MHSMILNNFYMSNILLIVIELKQLARFKKVRKVNKKNRSQLILSFTRDQMMKDTFGL